MDCCHGGEMSLDDSDIHTETNQNIWEEVFVEE
jgi:hypothetical protein